jgi:hypothetical protein
MLVSSFQLGGPGAAKPDGVIHNVRIYLSLNAPSDVSNIVDVIPLASSPPNTQSCLLAVKRVVDILSKYNDFAS